MYRQLDILFVILVTASVGLPAVAQQTVTSGKARSGTDCACPREGRRIVQNLEG